MHKKTIVVGFIVSVFVISAFASLQAVEVANANPIAYGPPKIAIVSPQYGFTYNSSQVTLFVGIQLFGYTYTSLEAIRWARYAVDNGITAPLNLEMPTVIGPGTMINSTDTISNLSDGNHTINIFLETSFGESANANVTFTINTKPVSIHSPSAPPTSAPNYSDSSLKITILSPRQYCDESNNVSVIVSVEVMRYADFQDGISQLSYRLDGETDIPLSLTLVSKAGYPTGFPQNSLTYDPHDSYIATGANLTNLANGKHYLVVNGKSISDTVISLGVNFSWFLQLKARVIALSFAHNCRVSTLDTSTCHDSYAGGNFCVKKILQIPLSTLKE